MAFAVDDDQDCLRLAIQYLHGLGYDAFQFLNGTDALAAIKKRRPDVVICNFAMPGFDGIQTLVEFQRRDPSIGCILATAKITPRLVEQVFKNGTVQVLLEKPISLRNLVEALMQVSLGHSGAVIRCQG